MRALGITLALGLVALAAACGSGGGGAAGDGHWDGVASNGDGKGPDGGNEPWPTSDPDPSGGTHEAPTFGGDDAGTSGPSTSGPFTCSDKTAASAGESTLTLTSGGLARTALVHLPPGYDPTKGATLVLNFHGYTSDGMQQMVITRMNAAADARGNVIVVYPFGIANSWNAGDCCGDAWTNSVDDVRFVKDMLSQLESRYCVDPKHVFATGFSNGGFLSYRLACEMADVFGAIAPVSGVMGEPAASCSPSRPMPVLHFHGTSDPVVRYDGGTPISPVELGSAGPVSFRSVRETMDIWRTNDGCLGAPKTIYAKGDATCQSWGSCRGGAAVALCTLAGDGHTWPGGVPIPFLGGTSSDISASDAMLNFFAAHPLP